MKKIAIVFNHFQITDGVGRTAISMANALCDIEGVEITLIPLFIYSKEMETKVNSKIHIKPIFKKYFRGFSKIVNLIPKKVLYKFIIKEKYDVEIGYCMELPIKIIASSTNAKALHLAWMHGYDEGLSLKKYYLKYDKLVCVSKFNCERLKREWPEFSSKVYYQYNLMDDSQIIADSLVEVDLPPRKNGLTFVSVGRQSHEKGYLRLVDVLNKLYKEGFSFNMWFIGDGPEHSDLVKKVKEYGLVNNIIFLGEKKNPHPYTRNADLFICSSYSEGYSTACVESCIVGTPVFTTNVSGALEIISDAQSGFVVEQENIAIYEKMKNIIMDKNCLMEHRNSLLSSKLVFGKQYRLQSMILLLELINEHNQ